MKLKQLLTEERAVSPVIGVILMVAITVILAAVIGTFVLGLGQNVNSAPSASFSFDFTEVSGSYSVAVTHEGGDTLSSDNSQHINITASGATERDWLSEASGDINAGTTCYFGDGDNCTTDNTGSAGNIDPGSTVRVLWIGSDGSSSTIGSQDAPS